MKENDTLTPAAGPAAEEQAGHPGPTPDLAAAKPEGEALPTAHQLLSLPMTDLLARLDAIATAHIAIGGQLADIKTELADVKAQLSGVGDGIAAELDELRQAIEEGAAMAAKKKTEKPSEKAPPKKDAQSPAKENGGGAGDAGETGETGERGKHE